MEVKADCEVHVVSAPQFFDHSLYEIPDGGTDAERIGAFSAKSCYDAYGKDGRGVVENQRAIIEHAHGSVLEHSNVSIFIEGVTRALTLELNRHRTFSISQRSTRYTKEEDSAIVLEPFYASIWNKYHLAWDRGSDTLMLPEEYENPDPQAVSSRSILPNDLRLLSDFLVQCQRSVAVYSEQVGLLEYLNPNKLEGFALRKWARGKARNVLPHALETRGVWTTNMRGWRWFVELRMSRHAEPEIRRLAEKVLVALRPIAPTYFEDFNLKQIVDGIPEYVPTHHKV